MLCINSNYYYYACIENQLQRGNVVSWQEWSRSNARKCASSSAWTVQAQVYDCITIVHALCNARDAETIGGKYRQQRDVHTVYTRRD